MSRLVRLARLRGDRRGSAAVEFALLAPVFFAVLLGVVQAGWGFQNYSAMRQLSADTARYMIVNTAVSNTDIGTTFTAAASQAPYMLSEFDRGGHRRASAAVYRCQGKDDHGHGEGHQPVQLDGGDRPGDDLRAAGLRMRSVLNKILITN